MRARPALTLAVIAALCLGLVAPAEASDPRARKHQVDRALQHLKADMDETSAALRHAANDKSLLDIVRNGIPGTEMPSFAIALPSRFRTVPWKWPLRRP
jgi:hypothetical protein